jgi:propionyl-CoA synthetase
MLAAYMYSYFQGYYDTMDAGYMDEEGYLYVMSRVDDVINVAGHRISAGAIEEVLMNTALVHHEVTTYHDELKKY